MKITKKDFEEMQKKYDQEVKKGQPGKGESKEVTDQTNWIIFDRETIEEVLSQTDKDPKKGGIKIYFTEYTEETAKQIHPKDWKEYVGRMTLVLSPVASNEKSLSLQDDGGNYYNKGQQCPPRCE